jgi:uncharacterized protein (DUF58 family)
MNDRQRRYRAEGERAGLRYALGLPRVAPVGGAGVSLSQRAGSSLEFKDYREYQPGDDLRHVDWNAYARSDQLSVKLFREEVNPHLDVVLDSSRSMALEDSAKEAATLGLAAFFATAAANAGFSHAAWRMGQRFEPISNGAASPVGWEEVQLAHRGDPTGAFGRSPPAWRPRGVRVLLSDLLWLGDPLAILGHFADRASAVVVVQVLAEADANPPERGNLRLIDSETDQVREIVVDALAATRYREALARHQQNWHRACRQVGAVLSIVIAERLLRDWKLDDLVAAEVLKVV